MVNELTHQLCAGKAGVHAGEWLSANSIKNPLHPAYPFTPKFRTTVPGGRLDAYLDRWSWTSNETNGMLEMWLGTSTSSPNFDAAKRMSHNNMSMYQSASDYANDPPMLPND